LRWIATTVCGACGAALLLLARAMDHAWFERHVLIPAYYPWAPGWVPRDVRIAVAALGVALVAAAWPIGRALARATIGGTARVALAVVLALCASELILHRGKGPAAPWRADKVEFRAGRLDPKYGWVMLPSRATVIGTPEPRVLYAIDEWGDRAASTRGGPDPDLPSLVVAGESIAAGHGIAYEDTFGAVMGKDLGLQVVNVGCGGYGSDQALLRLADALDRLKRPVAAVITFVPIMLSRNLQDYRPRLALRGGALQLVPLSDGFFAHLRLRDLVVNEVPYLGDRTLRESIQLTAAILRETDRTVRSHRAEPLFAVFSIGPWRRLDEHPEGALIRQLFVDQGLPYELIDVDRGDLVPVDGHPGPAAHRRAAAALEAALRPRLSPAQ
jgi:hypothetical protein